MEEGFFFLFIIIIIFGTEKKKDTGYMGKNNWYYNKRRLKSNKSTKKNCMIWMSSSVTESYIMFSKYTFFNHQVDCYWFQDDF